MRRLLRFTTTKTSTRRGSCVRRRALNSELYRFTLHTSTALVLWPNNTPLQRIAPLSLATACRFNAAVALFFRIRCNVFFLCFRQRRPKMLTTGFRRIDTNNNDTNTTTTTTMSDDRRGNGRSDGSGNGDNDNVVVIGGDGGGTAGGGGDTSSAVVGSGNILPQQQRQHQQSLMIGNVDSPTSSFLVRPNEGGGQRHGDGGSTHNIHEVSLSSQLMRTYFGCSRNGSSSSLPTNQLRIELGICSIVLFMGLFVEYSELIEPHQRPIPYQQLYSTGEYILNQVYNEKPRDHGDTVPSEFFYGTSAAAAAY